MMEYIHRTTNCSAIADGPLWIFSFVRLFQKCMAYIQSDRAVCASVCGQGHNGLSYFVLAWELESIAVDIQNKRLGKGCILLSLTQGLILFSTVKPCWAGSSITIGNLKSHVLFRTFLAVVRRFFVHSYNRPPAPLKLRPIQICLQTGFWTRDAISDI